MCFYGFKYDDIGTNLEQNVHTYIIHHRCQCLKTMVKNNPTHEACKIIAKVNKRFFLGMAGGTLKRIFYLEVDIKYSSDKNGNEQKREIINILVFFTQP